MNPKVLALVGWVRKGFELTEVEDELQGGVRVHLTRGNEHRSLRFEHFEVPAMLQECTNVGVAK